METSIKQDHVPQADLPGQIRPGLRLGFLFADASWESWKTPRLSLREHAVGSVRGESLFFLALNTLISEALGCRCDERHATHSPERSRAPEPHAGSLSRPWRQIPAVILRAAFCRGCSG